MTFSPENYTEFNEKLLSISKIADDLYYVKKYKIFYDAKELRITTPPSELNIFTDRYNQKQVRINNNDILFNNTKHLPRQPNRSNSSKGVHY